MTHQGYIDSILEPNVIYPHSGQPPIRAPIRVTPLKSSDRKKFYPVYPPPPYIYLLIVDKMSINMPTIDSATRLQLAIEELAKNPGISQREIAPLRSSSVDFTGPAQRQAGRKTLSSSRPKAIRPRRTGSD